MRAIQKLDRGPGLELTDVPPPICGPHDVLIAVEHAGVCGTDVHIDDWDEWAQGRIHPPVVVGHEFAGRIQEVGIDVRADYTVGQSVTAEGHIVCGHCLQCRTGNAHVCRNTQIIGVDRNGAFADLIAMPATNIVPLNEIPTEIGAIMDPLGNAFHTVLSAHIPGNTVLIVGCGPIGCFAVGVARAAGAARVIAVDMNRKRLDLAKTMGAHTLIDPTQQNVTEAVRDLTQGEGVDVVCEMSGNPTALKQTFECVRPGGQVNLLGLPREEVPLRVGTDIIFKGVTIYGVIGRRMYETWHQMRHFLSSGLLDPRPVITHSFPLSNTNEALATIRAGQAGKVILQIGAST
jgi:threonine 3-dehydrogenase